ncbi:TPA: glycosyl transferase family 1, partial [Klebsiella pneumoniae]|nr:glycosyl transferase family 1 [Klebsiella pneumoniae]
MDSVGIFRNQLFKKSEVFIRQQAESLTRHKIHYIGRKLYGDPPDDASYKVINENNTLSERISEIWNVLTRDSISYLKMTEQ